MDIISMALASYLSSVGSLVAGQAGYYVDTLGYEPKSVMIHYGNYDIGFEYQRWKIKDDTVCMLYEDNIRHRSECTVQARYLFRELCSEMSKKNTNDIQYNRLRGMYCNSANSYRPKVAELSTSREPGTIESARQACNAATIQAMGAQNPEVRFNRDVLCRNYKELSGSP